MPFPVISSLPELEGDDRAQTWHERFVLQRNRTMLGPIYSSSVAPSEDLLDALRYIWSQEQRPFHPLAIQTQHKHNTRLREDDDRQTATTHITSISAIGCNETKVSISRMICTEITQIRCFHASFHTDGAWFAATYSWRICGIKHGGDASQLFCQGSQRTL